MRIPSVAGRVAFVLVVCSLPDDALAERVRVGLLIEIGSVFGELEEVFGQPIASGDVVRGTLTYDASAPDGLPSPTEGAYDSTGTLSLATRTPLSLPLRDIRVYEQSANPPQSSKDSINVYAFTDLLPGYYSLSASLFLYGAGQNGDTLPPTVADLLAAFGGAGVFLFSANKIGGNPPYDTGTHELTGTVRLVPSDPQPVPEPGTLLLVGPGAAIILRRRLRSRQVPLRVSSAEALSTRAGCPSARRKLLWFHRG